MRLLADENVPAVVVESLRTSHDITWILADRPSLSDPAVLALAEKEDRIPLTFDKDFGTLLFSEGRSISSGVILFRISLPSPEEAARFVIRTIRLRNDWRGHFSVVTDERIRMRPLPK